MNDPTRMPSPRRRLLALGIVLLTWGTFLGLMWLIFRIGPVVIPLWLFLPGFVLTLVFGVGLVASKRWSGVWQRLFDPTVRVPAWIWIGGMTTICAVVLASIVQPLSIQGVVWIGVLSLAAWYALVAASRRRWLNRAVAYPYWIAAAIVGTVSVIIGLSTLAANTLLSIVFLLALLLFSFHVWFILPLTLYQAHTDQPDWSLETYPSLSVLIPAYNEHTVVGPCIESVLATTYPDVRLEIVVIDDGSTDGTYYEAAAYTDADVTVIRRENGGKHAALNLGLACSSGEVVATVDADSRPEPTAIERMVAQLQSDPTIGALSANVLAANANTFLAGLQRIEYAISNTNRRAYSVFDAVPVVPGCLGIYRRTALEDVWRYDPDTVTEDFDLTVKLLKHGWRVRHGTGVVWTIVPRNWRSLWRQRLRWYQGGLETLRKHKDALVSPRYDYLHALTLPARFVSHLFGPVLSVVILLAVIWGFLTAASWYLGALVVLFFALTTLITLYSIVLEDEPLWEVLYAPVLFVGYRHFIDCSIGVGNIRALFGSQRW